MDGAGMRNVIQQMLDVEGQAKKAVAAAETQAREIAVRAREVARQMLDEAKRGAAEQARADALKTVEDANARRDARVATEMKADAPVIEKSKTRLPAAVQMVVREVLGK